MKKTAKLYIASALLFAGCVAQDDYSVYFCEPESNLVDIKYDSLVLERFVPEVYGVSYVGYSGLSGDKLYFADHLYANLYRFDADVKFEDVVIRRGNGPHEIPTNGVEAYFVSADGHHYFLDSTTNLFEFDKDFNLVNSLFYYWSKKLTQGEKCERTDSYCTSWGTNVNLFVSGNKMYTNVSGESEDFNITIPEYYKLARIIEPRDLFTGAPYPLLGRLSPAIGYMTAFQGSFFTITDEGDFHVAYEADDLMYVYDKNYWLKYSFGQRGRDMDKGYKPLSINNFRKELDEELQTRGHYTSMNVVGDFTFRTYVTGKPSCETRLQIYEGTTMVGDIVVPEGFNVIGKIGQYFYSGFICDEENETMEAYRFKLLEQN